MSGWPVVILLVLVASNTAGLIKDETLRIVVNAIGIVVAVVLQAGGNLNL